MESPEHESDELQDAEAGAPPGALVEEFDGFDAEGNLVGGDGAQDPLASIPPDESFVLPGEELGRVKVGVLGGAPGEIEGEDEQEREVELDLDRPLGFGEEELEREAELEDMDEGDEDDDGDEADPDDFQIVGAAPSGSAPTTAAPAGPGAMVLADQPGAKPTRKVVAGGVGGLLAAVIPIVLGLGDVAEFDDPAAQAALAGIVTALGGFAAAYLTKDRVSPGGGSSGA